MRNVGIIMRRELASYFATPLAYVFILIFLLLANAFTFYLGGFFERGQADLQWFFYWHPWLYLFLIPAVSMRLWAEERKSGSIELLMTQPVTLWEAVLGKYFAAWLFAGLALALTFPIWITVNYLGNPDNGTILAAYIGSLLLAGGYLAIGSCMSALTNNQVIAFILEWWPVSWCCWPAFRWCWMRFAAGHRNGWWKPSPPCRFSRISIRSRRASSISATCCISRC